MRHHHIKLGLFILLLFLMIADAATTAHMIVKVGTYDIEANPLMKLLLVTTDSVHSLWVVKLIVMAPLWILLTHVKNSWLVAVCTVYLVVVANSLWIINTVG
jgi:hypothetical protein